jgi:hypothetical protein
MVVPPNAYLHLHASSVHFDGETDRFLVLLPSLILVVERYYEDPYTFKPERFMSDTWNKDYFFAFSSGARCATFGLLTPT